MLNLSDFDFQNEERDNFEFTSTSVANPIAAKLLFLLILRFLLLKLSVYGKGNFLRPP
jgi:hypothetical protein